MVNLLKAFVLFTFGTVILTNLGNALEKRSGSATASTSSFAAGASLSAPKTQRKEPEAEYAAEEPSPAAKPAARNGAYAQVCASFDPVAHPEQAIDILEYASGVTGTPVDILHSVWRKETGHFDGSGLASGTCDVMPELALRCMVRSAGGCRIGSDGRPTDCANPDACHYFAMESMGKRFGWDQQYGDHLERMTCSCPGKDKETGGRKGYGGCCGPFQFSGAEIDDEYALPLNLDPMKFCDGALIAGWELKKHHDRKLRDGTAQRVLAAKGYTSLDGAAWHAAMSRYYGADEGGLYGNTAIAKWKEFHQWHLRDQAQPGFLEAKMIGFKRSSDSRLKYLERKMSRVGFASNL